MKLLRCDECGDMFNLTTDWKTCGCGITRGRYTDEVNAEYTGNATPFGIANNSFRAARGMQQLLNEKTSVDVGGVPIECFMIPAAAQTLKKI